MKTQEEINEWLPDLSEKLDIGFGLRIEFGRDHYGIVCDVRMEHTNTKNLAPGFDVSFEAREEIYCRILEFDWKEVLETYLEFLNEKKEPEGVLKTVITHVKDGDEWIPVDEMIEKVRGTYEES